MGAILAAAVASAACVDASRPTCGKSGCPAGMLCGPDGLCRTPSDGSGQEPAVEPPREALETGEAQVPDEAESPEVGDGPEDAGDGGGPAAEASDAAEIAEGPPAGSDAADAPDVPDVPPTDASPPDAPPDPADDAPADLPADAVRDLGEPCLDGRDCASGICADGVCCSTACTAVCRSCNQVGLAGTCSDVTSADDPDTCAAPTSSCSSTATCKARQGLPCGAGLPACLSGHCTDGVCCDTACAGVCMSCLKSSTGVPDGMCGPVKTGTDPDVECTPAGPASCGNDGFCDGAGACRKKAAGTACGPVCCPGPEAAQCLASCDGAGGCTVIGAKTGKCADPLACTDDTCEPLGAGSVCRHTANCGPGACCCDADAICTYDPFGCPGTCIP